MILFFDTETTGLYRDRLPFDHPDQPHLVQLACLLTQDNGDPVSMLSLVVNPGCKIPAGATDVHGIDSHLAEAAGITEKTAAGIFNLFAGRADLVVAHNAKFDLGVMACVNAREAMKSADPASFCTMEAASPIVDLPPTARMIAAGFNKPKPPKLQECIAHFFNETLDGAHDALVDVRACARVFFHLKALEA